MINAIRGLFSSLEATLQGDVTKYSTVRDARKILQQIKTEAQNLRKSLSENLKKSKTQ